MAFERIEIDEAKAKSSAGITITQNGKVVVALRKDVVAQVGFKAKDTFSALLGTDDDAGKLRILKAKDGVACARELARTGAFFFRLGMVPAIGVTPHKQRPIEARVVDGGIEIDLPPDDGPKLLPAPAKMPANSEAAATGGGARKGKSADEVFLNGITIDLTDGEETITFDGEGVAVSDVEARLVKILARPRPQPVAESFIIGNLWDKGRPPNATEHLRQLCTGDLKKSLAKIGLDLNAVKGVGYQLKDA
jgi:hypothetical protein